MARVYYAFDRQLEREVALKVLDASMQQVEVVERFRREAYTLARLRHPHIVQIYDYDRYEDLSFIVQQLQPGPTLEEELAALAAQGRYMDRDAVLEVLEQLADALDYAHSHKIIHRDLKPSNIIRNEQGEVVLTDFGIVKTLTGPPAKTQTGLVLGTPGYLSPEQARGNPELSPASDIYTLGVILFELLTGHLPFDHPQPMEVLLSHIQAPPPSPRSLRRDIPVRVERVVLKALAKDPAARYASAGAVVQALLVAWPAPKRPSIHSAPTTVNPAPRTTARTLAPPTLIIGSDAAAIGRTLLAAPLPAMPRLTRWPVWKRRAQAALAFMTLPVLLLAVVALFFAEIPSTKPSESAPTITIRWSTPVKAGGLIRHTFTPTFTVAPQFASTAAPTRTLAPTHTSTPMPTPMWTPEPALTTAPEAPTLAPEPPAFVPEPPMQAPAPSPTLAPEPPTLAVEPSPTIAPEPTFAPEPTAIPALPANEPPPPEPPPADAPPPQPENETPEF
jgi:serine/threonine-protein kinase